MRRVALIRLRFIYANSEDSANRLEAVYDRIFAKAKQNIMERKKLEQIGGDKHEGAGSHQGFIRSAIK